MDEGPPSLEDILLARYEAQDRAKMSTQWREKLDAYAAQQKKKGMLEKIVGHMIWPAALPNQGAAGPMQSPGALQQIVSANRAPNPLATPQAYPGYIGVRQ